MAMYDTAGGAKLIRDGELRDAAAIASRRAAEVFGLEVLREGIQDFEFNITRFFVDRAATAVTEGPTRRSIVFALPSEPGSLFKALSVFALRDINLTKLESRPIRGRPWEYLFYVDVAAPRDDLQCARALVAPRRVRPLGFARWERIGRGARRRRRRRTRPRRWRRGDRVPTPADRGSAGDDGPSRAPPARC